jgi:spermidine synthase
MKAAAKPFILIAAGASGAASLMYLQVWMRRSVLVFGGTMPMTAAVTLTFVAGLAIGTWTWGRWADRRPHSALTAFAAIQLATGLYGFASLWIFHGVEALYLAAYPLLTNHTNLLAITQLMLSALAVAPPAILMGGSLPLLARRLISSDSGFVSSIGSVYAWNALGAAAGGAAMTYGLLPAVGLTYTGVLAAAVNVLLGIAAFSAELRTRRHPAPPTAASLTFGATGDPSDRIAEFLILIGFGVSAAAVTTLEISCARLIAMVMGSSVYVHGASVVVALAGMGIGAALYGRLQQTTEAHQRWLAVLEFLIAFTAALSMIFLSRMPFLFARFFPLLRDSFGRQVAAHLTATAMVLLLPFLLFGAMFPAVAGSLGAPAVRFGSAIGTAYAANTTGVVAGACLAEFALIPAIGLHATMNLAVLVSVGAGFALWWRIRAPKRPRLQALAPAAAALLIVWILPAWPREAFAAGAGFVAPRLGTGQAFGEIVKGIRLLYYRDGRSSAISVDETGRTRFLRSSGDTIASADPVDMASQLLLGHLPMLLHPAPRDVLVLGLGTGITAAAVARYPVEGIDVVELEPAAAGAARFFDSYTRKVFDDPRVHLIIGDGRSRLLVVPKQYDVMILDAPDEWAAGSASLEFYRIAGARLKPGGIFVQCIHTRGLLPDDLERLAATLHAVFPHTQIWTSSAGNLLLLGARDSVAWDYRRLQQHFAGTPGVADDLNSIGIWQPFALFGAQVLAENETDAFTRDIREFNTDNRPVLEFRAPRSLYAETTSRIAKALNPFRRPGAPPIVGFDPERDLDADGAYLLGFAYASMGQPDLGIRYMERSTAMALDRPMFFVGLGNQYRAAGRISEARAAYERALSLDLNNVEALVSLGEIRLDEGQPEWTRVLSDRALRLAPQDARVHALMNRLQETER